MVEWSNFVCITDIIRWHWVGTVVERISQTYKEAVNIVDFEIRPQKFQDYRDGTISKFGTFFL